MQFTRLIIQGVQQIVFVKNEGQVNPKELKQLDYYNIYTECLFNLFILYYFVSITGVKPGLERTAAQSSTDSSASVQIAASIVDVANNNQIED